MHCDNFTEPISNPESSTTGRIDILFDCIKSSASETFEPDLVIKGSVNLRSFI